MIAINKYFWLKIREKDIKYVFHSQQKINFGYFLPAEWCNDGVYKR